MGDGYGGIDKVASSWTLRVGGALHGLAQPLPFVG